MRGLRTFDMNLLAAVEAFVLERNVTRAAVRLGLTQPAASNMLRRLRELFKDEILVRTPRGMAPTVRALELTTELQPILHRIQNIFESKILFDPATSTSQFRLRLSDLLESLLLPGIVSHIGQQAPHVSVSVSHLPPEATIESLETEKIDIAVSTGLACPNSIRSSLLFRDRMVCVMRSDHELAKRKLSIERFLEARHVRVSISTTDERFVEGALRDIGKSRMIALHVPHWTVVRGVLRETDLLCTMPQSYARQLGSGLVLRELPFDSIDFDWEIYWHSRNDTSPSRLWLCQLVENVVLTEIATPMRKKNPAH